MPDVRLGPFFVRTERAKVEAYKRAIGAAGQEVPAAFPICWLGQPEIRAAIEGGCGDRLPLHEGQTFDYVRRLEVGAEYRLSLLLCEEADPPRLRLQGEVTTATGEACLRIETLLRLVALPMELSA
ncbi:MAG: hypothetical protein QOF41_2389 [Methylobacteriaceae bacterium]|nr:hypothetical protein [Methylobacteriaceae bacterium]